MNTAYILQFLKELQENNEKSWMDDHRQEYETARENFKAVIAQLLLAMSASDEGLSTLKPKDCIFRINRDIRFSKNKSPYKINFGASMTEGGKKSGQAGYYIHLQPYGESFIGGGIYHPSSEVLYKVRQEIDYNAAELKDITEQATFKEYFGTIKGDQLKRPPKGYTADHPNIELLKMKDYLVIHSLTDEEVTSDQFLPQIIEKLKVIVPFVQYLNVAIS